MEKKIYIEGETDQKISAHLERSKSRSEGQPNDTIILMIHNFPGNKDGSHDLFKKLEHTTSLKGYDAIRFDFIGCGDSDGKTENFNMKKAGTDLTRIMNWCRQEGYKNFIFVAEGLGVSIAVMNLAPDVRAFISVSGLFDLQEFCENYFGKALKNEKDADYITISKHKIGKAFIHELHETNLNNYLKRIRCPLLILHGTQDKVAPVHQLDLIREHIPARRIEITTFQGGEHSLNQENHRKYIYYHAMQFIEKYA